MVAMAPSSTLAGAGDVAGGVLVAPGGHRRLGRAWRRARRWRWWRGGRPLARQASMPPASSPTRCSWPMSRHWRTSSSRSWSSSRTKTSGRSGSTSQPSQLANDGRNVLANEPGMCPAANAATGRTSTTTPPAARWASTSSASEPVEAGQRVVAAGSEPVQLGKPGEVGREGAEPGEEPLDEVVLVGDAEQWVRAPLAAERGGALGGAGGGAERPGAVGRVHGEVVGKLVVAAQRVEHLAGQRLGPLGAAQVGASDRADHQRAAGEQRHRPAVSDAGRRRGGPGCDPASPRPAAITRVGQARPCRRRRPGGAAWPAGTPLGATNTASVRAARAGLPVT